MDTINKIIKSDFLNGIMNFILDNIWILALALGLIVIAILLIIFTKKKNENNSGFDNSDNVGDIINVDSNIQNIDYQANINVEEEIKTKPLEEIKEDVSSENIVPSILVNEDASTAVLEENSQNAFEIPMVNEQENVEVLEVVSEEKTLEETIEIPKMANEIINDGIDIKKKCVNCNAENPYYYKVCSKCGCLLD